MNLARAKEVCRCVYFLNMDCPISLFIKAVRSHIEMRYASAFTPRIIAVNALHS